jgi:hypothetical protein
MTDNAEPANADQKISTRFTTAWVEALAQIGEQRLRDGTLPRSRRGGRQGVISVLIREAVGNYFHLPSGDEKSDTATKNSEPVAV